MHHINPAHYSHQRGHKLHTSAQYIKNFDNKLNPYAFTVSTDLENSGEWKTCFTVQGVHLPTGYYFGASATTGDLSDNHDVIAVKFYELDATVDPRTIAARRDIKPEATLFEPPRERREDKTPMSNAKIFFIILIGTLSSVALAVFAIMYYQKHKENSRKRFYW